MTEDSRYTSLIKEMFEILDRVEETDEGLSFHPTYIVCLRECDRAKLNRLFTLLKQLTEDEND